MAFCIVERDADKKVICMEIFIDKQEALNRFRELIDATASMDFNYNLTTDEIEKAVSDGQWIEKSNSWSIQIISE
jgi:hypothetical protein